MFDFVEANDQLRMVGFPSDLGPFEDDHRRHEFLQDLADLRAGLEDWIDYAQDECGAQNKASALRRAVQKLLEQFKQLEDGNSVSLRRLVAIGSDLSRFAKSEKSRSEVGETLSAMLDEKLDFYAEISHKHFGAVFAALKPLKSLELGEHSTGDLLKDIKSALRNISETDQRELTRLTPDSEAVLGEMLLELEEWDAELEDATGEGRISLIKRRFAEKYGAYSATFGRYLEKGSELSEKHGKRFDSAVKWYKRWDTLQSIVEWWQGIGGPPPS